MLRPKPQSQLVALDGTNGVPGRYLGRIGLGHDARGEVYLHEKPGFLLLRCRRMIPLVRIGFALSVAGALGAARAPVEAPRPFAGDPPAPVRLLLSQLRYAPGSHGRVSVEIGRNGYLVVLHAEPDGHVRVAFPLDPGGDAAVHDGDSVEIRGRGGRDAFVVEDSSGTGTWYAAISKRPFRFDSVAVDNHWDYRVIPHVASPPDAERVLTAFVQSIAAARFDYDIVDYRISLYAYAAGPGYRGPPPPPPPPPNDPWPWPEPWAGPWGWPVPWWPKPGPGPGPFYDRPPGSANEPAPKSAPGPVGDQGSGHGSPPVSDRPTGHAGHGHR